MKRALLLSLSVVLLAITSFAQQTQPLLTIDGKIATPITITANDWAKLPHTTVTAHHGHGKETHQFEGVPLKALLEKAGVVDPQKELKGKAMLQFVVITASDGYRALFSIGEIDAATGATTDVLVADKLDGKPLDAHEGPLQLVVPTDKRPSRAARMVSRITVGSIE